MTNQLKSLVNPGMVVAWLLESSVLVYQEEVVQSSCEMGVVCMLKRSGLDLNAVLSDLTGTSANKV